MTIALTLILTGVLLLCAGVLRRYYNNIFTSENVCKYEALVTDIKDSVSTNGDLVCPYVEYSGDSGIVKANHYVPVSRSALNFRKGDTITIIVHPGHPKIFSIADMDHYENDFSRKLPPALIIIGGALLAFGILTLILFAG